MGTDYMREEYKGLILRLEYDQACENPLETDEGVHITYRANARSQYGNTPSDQEEHEAIAQQIGAGTLIGLPVYVYQHGGVIIRASDGNPFDCPWDSGQSGYVYVTRKTALEWQGGKVLTAKRRAATLKSLRSVVETYSQWCNGECYGYIISTAPTDDNPEGEELDSCWGFIGTDHAMQSARESADYWAIEAPKIPAREDFARVREL